MKHEILRKSFDITFYLLVMTLCFNTIKCGKVTVKHNLLPSNYLYKRFFFAPSRNNKKPTDFKNELKISRFLYKIFFTTCLPLIRSSSFRRVLLQHLLELPVKEWGGGEEAEGDGQENARCLEVAGESEEIACWDVDHDVAHEGNPHH